MVIIYRTNTEEGRLSNDRYALDQETGLLLVFNKNTHRLIAATEDSTFIDFNKEYMVELDRVNQLTIYVPEFLFEMVNRLVFNNSFNYVSINQSALVSIFKVAGKPNYRIALDEYSEKMVVYNKNTKTIIDADPRKFEITEFEMVVQHLRLKQSKTSNHISGYFNSILVGGQAL